MKNTMLLLLIILATLPQLQAANPLPSRQAQNITYPNSWEKLKLKGLNLFRLEVPGGWLIREGFGKMIGLGSMEQTRMMMFIEDPEHHWQVVDERAWELHRLKGQNIHRLMVPGGWIVREAWSKFGNEGQVRMMTFVPDPHHSWNIEPRH